MPWSIFTQGGGPGAALQWARDLLASVGAPDTPATEQFVYDWMKAEGGGGMWNPLNQGPVSGHPELTTTGSQYGGGAADFASRSAGLQGAVDYLNYPNYKQTVLDPLVAGNTDAARAGLVASPWASGHYGGRLNSDPLPSGVQTVTGTPGGSPGSSSGSSGTIHIPVGPYHLDTGIPDAAGMQHYTLIALGVVGGLVLVILGAVRSTDSHPIANASEAGKKAGEMALLA